MKLAQNPSDPNHQGAYSIVEALIAATLLALALAAAAVLALTMTAQEENNSRIARAYNLQEQAARLYQLGLEPATIASLLPAESTVISISFNTNSVPIAGVGDVDQSTCRMIFQAGTPITSDSLTPASRTNDVVVVRPSIR